MAEKKMKICLPSKTMHEVADACLSKPNLGQVRTDREDNIPWSQDLSGSRIIGRVPLA